MFHGSTSFGVGADRRDAIGVLSGATIEGEAIHLNGLNTDLGSTAFCANRCGCWNGPKINWLYGSTTLMLPSVCDSHYRHASR